ncbi:hypothetical protein DERF_006529 [Dermatophagoides farinae]|uniref:Uncharacterized protein n=1 Tax=Dermatophagoides farinae TaxID=6954 RepID=A0A922I6E6_DERFA|nr:hypothetical protein DERF_006529 [Dermatophagoides farinae]
MDGMIIQDNELPDGNFKLVDSLVALGGRLDGINVFDMMEQTINDNKTIKILKKKQEKNTNDKLRCVRCWYVYLLDYVLRCIHWNNMIIGGGRFCISRNGSQIRIRSAMANQGIQNGNTNRPGKNGIDQWK